MGVKPCKYGHAAGRDTQHHCLECRRQGAKEYRAANPDEAKAYDSTYHMMNSERRNGKARDYYRANFKRTMLQNASKRARQGGYACTITEDDITVPEFCPLIGIRIETGGKLRASSPSLDKIVPALGYVPSNVWVISWRANMLKNDATVQELELLVANLKKRCTVMPWVITPPATLGKAPWER